MTRDVAPRLHLSKPGLIHCKFFPPLTGRGGKMSGSVGAQAVFMTDTPKQVDQLSYNYYVRIKSLSYLYCRSKLRLISMPSAVDRILWNCRYDVSAHYIILTLVIKIFIVFLSKRELGANLSLDVSYEWLTFFLESDERLAEIGRDYASGAMLTGEVKKELIDVLTVLDELLIIICVFFADTSFVTIGSCL